MKNFVKLQAEKKICLQKILAEKNVIKTLKLFSFFFFVHAHMINALFLICIIQYNNSYKL